MVLRKVAAVCLLAVATVAGSLWQVPRLPAAGAAPVAAAAARETVVRTVYTTGYSWYSNTPPLSATIAYGVLHATAGGTGTYADPVTLAVGHSLVNGKDVLDFPRGMRVYLPDVRRYFIVEDTCGDGPAPQNGPCHRGRNVDGSGSTVWLDLWIGGRDGTAAAATACASRITDASGRLHTAVFNPAPNYLVAPGSLLSKGRCTAGFGNTLIRR